jgi:hypothetical protein
MIGELEGGKITEIILFWKFPNFCLFGRLRSYCFS